MNVAKLLISLLVILLAFVTGFVLAIEWFYFIMIAAIYIEITFLGDKKDSVEQTKKEEPMIYKKKCKECNKPYEDPNKFSRFCKECRGGEIK